MSGQDTPGIPGLSWSAFGGQRSPAWGGAAAQLQTPPSTVREAMLAAEAQAKAAQASALRPAVQQGDAVSHAMTAEAWMQEALRTRPDPRTGQLACPMCSRPAADYHTLAQHMKDKHGHEPPARATMSVSMSDLLGATSRFPSRSVAPVPRLTSKQMQGVKGLLKAFPTEHALADALRQQKPLLANKKRLSRLKRIILKERGEKAFTDATEDAAKAARALEEAQTQRDNIQEQLKVAIEKLTLDASGQRLLDAAALTHLQVVEAAANDVEQSILDAERKLQTVQAKLSKLQMERDAQESESVSALETPPESSRDAAASAEAAEESSSPAPLAAVAAAGQPSRADEGRAAYVSERPFVSLSDLQKYAGVAQAQREWSSGPPGLQRDVPEEAGAAAEEADEGYESSVEGLNDFEDILASWMHSSSSLLADKHTVPLVDWLHSRAVDEYATPSTKTAHEQQQTPSATDTATPAAAASAEQKGEPVQRGVEGGGKSDAPESNSDDDENIGPDDWDDILAVWMTAVGLPNLGEDAQPDSASESSDSLSDDEDRSGLTAEQPKPPGAGFPETVAASPAAGAQDGAKPQHLGAQPPETPPASGLLQTSQAGPQQDVPAGAALPKAQGVPPRSAQAPFQAPAPSQAPGSESLARQLPQLPAPLEGTALSQFLASYHTGQTNTAGRPVLAMGPRLNTQASDALPLLGAGFPGSRSQTATASTSRRASNDGSAATQQASPGAQSPAASSAAMAAVAQMASKLQKSSSGSHLPAAVGASPGATSQITTTRSLQSQWQAMLKHQGQPVPVEELLDRRLFGNASNETSLMASPVGSGLSTPQLSMAIDRSATRPSSAGGSWSEAMPDQLRQHPLGQPGLGQPGQPKEAPRSAQAGPAAPSISIDKARQRALEAILKKHELPVSMQPSSVGPKLPQVPMDTGDGGLSNLSEQELLMLQQTPQTSQTHDDISFWLEWQAQQHRQQQQQVNAQALQQGLQGMSLHQQGVNSFAMGSYGSAHAMSANQAMQPLMEAGWPGAATDSGPLGSHDFTCEVCGITCCGLVNFEQHCSSKKHLRKAAAAAGALTGASVVASDSTDTERNTTYVGLQAQCRSYCKQIISTELNRAVLELLQQLLFWQERAKSASPYNLAKRKRLVSGLREVAKAVRLRKACTVVVAPNIEHIEAEGGLDDLLTSILTQAEASNIPIVFALSRKKLGQMFGCRKKMSAIAILDYSGAEAVYRHMEALAEEGRQSWLAHHGSGSVASHPSSQPQATAQGPQAHQSLPLQSSGLGGELARSASRPPSAGSAPLDPAQAQRPPGQVMPPPPQQQQQPRGMPPQFGGIAKSPFLSQHQRPYGGPPQQPQLRAGQHLPPRYQMPQDPRFQSPSSQYRLPPRLPPQQLLQRQSAIQQHPPMAPNEAMGLHPGLQQCQPERWTPYEQHMALLQLQQQQQQGAGYDAADAAQLTELQRVPMGSLGSLSSLPNDAIMSLQALGQPFEQGQLAALYSQQQQQLRQQQLSQQLQLSSLSDSEHQGFGLQDPAMQQSWHNPDPGPGPWMP